MAKSNPLGLGLAKTQVKHQVTPTVADPVPVVSVPSASKKPPSRQGLVMIGGHFAPEVQTALKVIAAEERTTVQALLSEGIDAVLVARRKPAIAGLSGDGK